MTTQIQPLRERLTAINTEIGTLLEVDPNTGQAKTDDSGKAIVPNWTSEQEARYDALTNERAGVMAHIQRVNDTLASLNESANERRVERLQAQTARQNGTLRGDQPQPIVIEESQNLDLARNFTNNARHSMAERLSQEQGKSLDEAYAEANDTILAWETFNVHGEQGLRDLTQQNGRDFTNILKRDDSTTPFGGIVTPKEVLNELTKIMKYFAPYLSLGTVRTVTSGRKMGHPWTDDTTNEGEWVAENKTIGSADVVLKETVIQPMRLSSKEVTFSYDWLRSVVLSDANAEIYGILGERMGRGLSNACFAGVATSGAVQTGIKGAVEAAIAKASRKRTVATLAIEPSDIDKIYFGVDSAYRSDSSFLMNITTIAHLAGKTVGSGDARALLTPDLQNSNLLRYRGRPIVEENGTDSIPTAKADNLEVAFFGPLRNVRINRLAGSAMSFRWGDEAAYAKFGRIGLAQVEYIGVGVTHATAKNWDVLMLKA